MLKNLNNCQNKNKNTGVVWYLETQVFRPLAQSYYYITDWIVRGPRGEHTLTFLNCLALDMTAQTNHQPVLSHQSH